jgi:hypothetical protein
MPSPLAPATPPLAPDNVNTAETPVVEVKPVVAAPPPASATPPAVTTSVAPAPAPAAATAVPPTPTPEALSKQQLLQLEMETYKKKQKQEEERLQFLKEGMAEKKRLQKLEAEEAEKAADAKIATAEKAQTERDKWKYPDTKLPQYKPPEKTSLPEQWGSLAMIFAMLGSAMTRGGAVSALNAATAAMKGFQQGDKDRADEAYNVWKTQNDNMLKMIQFDLDRRRDAFEGIKSLQELEELKGTAKYAKIQAQVKAYSAALNDENDLRIQAEQGVEGSFKHLESMSKLADEIQKVSKAQDLRKKTTELVNNPKFINAEPREQLKQLMDLGYEKNLDEYADAAVKQAEEKIKETEKGLTPLQQERKDIRTRTHTPGTSEYENYMRSVNAMAFYNEKFPSLRDNASPEEQAEHYQRLSDVMSVNPDFHADYYGKAAILNSHWTDLQYKPAQMLNNLNTTGGHLGEIKELIRLLEERREGQFDAGQLALVNKIRSTVASAFGQPIKEVTDVRAAAPIVMDEVFKLVVNGAGTGGERKELQALLNANLPLSTLKSNANVLTDLLGSRVESMETSFINSVRALNPKMKEEEARKLFLKNLNGRTVAALGDYLHIPAKELSDIRKEVYGDLQKKGGTTEKPNDKNQKTTGKQVGDTIKQGDKYYRVTKVDENGKPIEAVETTAGP